MLVRYPQADFCCCIMCSFAISVVAVKYIIIHCVRVFPRVLYCLFITGERAQ
jgi:hypothetical protein